MLTELFKKILDSTPLVQGGMTLMIAGWVGYQLRAIPARVHDWFRHWTSRRIEIRERNPHYDAWLDLLTESAVRPGGPRTLEVRFMRGEDARSTYKAGSDAFWARVCSR